MPMAIGKGGNVLLVRLANRVVVVKARASIHKDMINPRAEEAGDFEAA